MQQQQPPPPPPGYAPQQQGTTVVMTQPPMMVAGAMMFRDHSVPYTCHFCHAQITTSTEFEVGAAAWLFCVILAVVGCWLGCCLIPFCVDGCKDCIHRCPNCQQVVGRYSRL